MAKTTPVELPHIDRIERVRVRPSDALDADFLLEQLGDPRGRAILSASGRPHTAAEIRELCDIPTSTVYRKLDELSDAGLLEETRRLSDDGAHPTQYRRRFDELRLSFDGAGGVVVEVDADPGPG
jgi:DNA-binding transcriptional ArsR family regulator